MEAYKVGVSLALTSNHAEVLSLLARDLLGVHVKVKELQEHFGRLGTAIAGAFAIGAGAKLIETMGHLIEKGNDLVKIQQDMAQAGMSAKEVQDAYNLSWELTRQNMNMGAADIMKLQNHARTIFGDSHHAAEAMPGIVDMGSFLRSYQGREKGGKTHEALTRELEAALKSGEIGGKITPEDMNVAIKSLTAMKILYGDQVSVVNYLSAQRRAGVSLRTVSDEFRYGIFPALVQENKDQAGVSFMTAWQKLVAGTSVGTGPVAQLLQMGLINPGGEERTPAKYDAQGNLKSGNLLTGRLHIGGLVEQQLFAEHPLEWIDRVFKPALDKLTAGSPNKNILEAQLISRIFPNRNAAFIMTELVQQTTKLHKDARLLGGVNTEFGTYKDKSFDYQMQSFQTQWEGLMAALGAPAVGTATAMLRAINSVLADLAAYASKPENAEFLGKVVYAVGLLGTALVAGGSAAILAAIGPVGGLVALITTLAGLAASVNWKKEWELFGQNLKSIYDYVKDLNDKWNALKDSVYKTLGGYRDAFVEKVTEIQTKWDEMKTAAIDWIASLVTSTIEGITSIPDKVHDSIVAMGDQVVNYIKETFEGLLAKLPGGLFSKSSFEGGGGGGGGGAGIYNASLGGGGTRAGLGDMNTQATVQSIAGLHGKTRNLNEDFAARLKGLHDAGVKAGVDFSVSDGFRTEAQQEALRRTKPALAAMGRSMHQDGLAADLKFQNDRARQWVHQHAGEHGLRFPMGVRRPGHKYEPWHIEPTGGQRNVLPPVQDEPVKIHTAVNLSGRKFADNTTQHQGRMANGPSHGGQAFDGTRQHAGPDSAHLAA